MQGLNFAAILTTCLFRIVSGNGLYFPYGNQIVECPNNMFDQKIVCRPGQALSSVTWDEEIPHCRHFQATCLNATSSCFEHCEWRPNCQTNASVRIEMEYVRGIDVQYGMMSEEQTVSFLCCHSDDLKTGILDCDPKSSVLDGHSQPKLFSIMSQATAKDLLGNLPIKATYCPVLNIPTCPPDKIQTNLEGGSFPVPGGTAGSGAGAGGYYYGLSLLSCYGPSGMLYSINMLGCNPAGKVPSAQICLDACKASSTTCTGGITFYGGTGDCFFCPPNLGLEAAGGYTSFILCVTRAQYAQLKSFG